MLTEGTVANRQTATRSLDTILTIVAQSAVCNSKAPAGYIQTSVSIVQDLGIRNDGSTTIVLPEAVGVVVSQSALVKGDITTTIVDSCIDGVGTADIIAPITNGGVSEGRLTGAVDADTFPITRGRAGRITIIVGVPAHTVIPDAGEVDGVSCRALSVKCAVDGELAVVAISELDDCARQNGPSLAAIDCQYFYDVG